MIPRYSDPRITQLFSDAAKLKRWDAVELAAIKSRVMFDRVPAQSYETIKNALMNNTANIDWWHKRDKEINHDLNAYVDERRQYIPEAMRYLFHQDMTSYDTEEPAMALALLMSCEFVEDAYKLLNTTLRTAAKRYRYLAFLERTHGQWAKLRSFGGRIITWLGELEAAHAPFQAALLACRRSRMSGAIGNYGGELSMELEKQTLVILDLTPHIGATQITTRVIQAALAQSLQLLAEVLAKIANDIRLGARSGNPIVHEPFSKKQKGSSAMPHKKNTIRTEQMEGLLRMVRSYVATLVASIQTWEGRSIEQSSVERISWPDLFHLIIRMFDQVNYVVTNMKVYPDHMYREIVDSRGTYASDEAKNFLAAELAKRDVDAEVAYRIMQLGSFCAFEPTGVWGELREAIPASLSAADDWLGRVEELPPERIRSIEEIVRDGQLFPVDAVDATQDDVDGWNELLADVFSDGRVRAEWTEKFNISYLLRSEHKIFEHYGLAD